jgi:hypothetical protein
MNTKLEIREIVPCQCQSEGKIRVNLPEYDRELFVVYQGSPAQIRHALPEGTTHDAFLKMWLATMTKSPEKTCSIQRCVPTYAYDVTGVYKGTVQIDGDEYHCVGSEFDVAVDVEFEIADPLTKNDWVTVHGEFFVEYDMGDCS